MKNRDYFETFESRLSIHRDYFGENGTVFDSIFAISGYL